MTESRERFIEKRQELYRHAAPKPTIARCKYCGNTLLAAQELSRKAYGFEVDKNFYEQAKKKVLGRFEPDMFQMLEYEGRFA